MQFVVLYHTSIKISIWPLENATAMFNSIFELTIERKSVWVLFDTFSMLEVLFPQSFISGPILTYVSAETFSLSVDPRAFIAVAALFDQPASTISSVLIKTALKYTTVNECETAFALSLFELLIPAPFICGSILICHFYNLFILGLGGTFGILRIKFKFAKSLTSLLHSRRDLLRQVNITRK